MMNAQINTLLIPRDFPGAMCRALVVVCFVAISSVCMAQDEDVSAHRAAAEQGDADGQYNLGVRYRDGQGVAQDYEEAVRWFRAAAEQGHAGAQYNLGIAYDTGEGVPQDSEEAVRWYRAAAQQGHAGAQYNLGVAYVTGDGVPKDFKEFIKWTRAAAEQGHAGAQYNLARAYRDGQGVAQDYEEAVKWFRAAAEQGHARGQYNLGVAYVTGDGVPKDFKEFIKWTRAAAEQGHAPAQHNLARAYHRGDGVPRDDRESLKWYRAAAEQGHAESQLNLGRAYRDGVAGVPVDPYKAWWWFVSAARQGNRDAWVAFRRAQEPPLPARAFEIDTGTVFMRGGLLGSYKKVELFIDLENKTDKRLWAEVEFRLPGTGETLQTLKKVGGGSTTRFSWAAPLISWNTEYPFTISVFEDRKRKTPLGTKESFYYFDEDEGAIFKAEVLALGIGEIYRQVGFPELLWARDRLMWAEVPGTIADGTLRYDIQMGLFAEESKVHEECEHTALRAEQYGMDDQTDSAADIRADFEYLESSMQVGGDLIIERWFVQSCDAVSDYEVRLAKSRRGRTDIFYRKLDSMP